ncbi:hypothetical protein MBEHAL_2180 [Halarchaeum acidiphilum MH1-52-1]|uniref:Uncharacterized protein n=1 Tax=Halarchaeum acidiphilum MH1-52-1 TaxID=1261545 RepID=U2YWL3_9EURY|nr:hypothetical protein [Halarchaeum acidiphilum]GAD53420.1 hypothetical protein MBEHAL_2180 [Halarchaeum acidiphilum MH1-52-1]
MTSAPSIGGYIATVVTVSGFAALFALALFSAGGVAALVGAVGFLVVFCAVLLLAVNSLVQQWLRYAIESEGLPEELAGDG